MHVIEYLRTNTLEDLQAEYGIKSKVYSNGLVVLNYSQINSPKYHHIVKECRGLIIDIFNLKPVSRTFDRFFNLNENENDQFNPHKLKIIEEKADGSLISVYWFKGKWNIATRGNAYAEGSTAYGITFHDIFIEAIGGIDINVFMKDLNRNFSYTFELCSIYNKVVKFYETPTVYLINIVNVADGTDADHRMLDHIVESFLGSNIKRPKVYNIKMRDISNSFKDFPATEEGYVLIDELGNRVKVKNPAYVNLHHLKGNGEITPKRITDVVFNGETKEVLSYFPEYKKFFDPYQEAYDFMIKEINHVSSELNRMNLNQKDFAERAVKFHYCGILFSIRKGLTLDETLSKMSINSKVVLIESVVKIFKGEL